MTRERPCAHCGVMFRGTRLSVRFCSASCVAKDKQRKHLETIAQLLESGEMPQSKSEAKRKGIRFYMSVPCQKGHSGVRATHNSNCIYCIQARHEAQWEERKEGIKQEKAGLEPKESLMTSPIWIHLLPNWQPVVVRRV